MKHRTGGLGEFEQLVLAAVKADNGFAYGFSVYKAVQEICGRREIGSAPVYATLARLCDKGYLKFSQSKPEPRRGGRSRRLFTMTSQGWVVLVASFRANAAAMKLAGWEPARSNGSGT